MMCVCQRPSTKEIAETGRNPTLFQRQADKGPYIHTIHLGTGVASSVSQLIALIQRTNKTSRIFTTEVVAQVGAGHLR